MVNTTGWFQGRIPAFVAAGWRGGWGAIGGGTQKGETSARRLSVSLLGTEGWGEGVVGRLGSPPRGRVRRPPREGCPRTEAAVSPPHAVPATFSPAPHVPREEAAAAARGDRSQRVTEG